jgi:hypothetical protein
LAGRCSRGRGRGSANAEGADLLALDKRYLALVDDVGIRFDCGTVHGHVRLDITDDVGLTRPGCPAGLCREVSWP